MTLNKLTKVLAGVFAFGAVCFATPSQAAQPAIDFTTSLTSAIGANYNLGWEFTVGATDINVTSLGYFDKDQDGLTDSHQVALWTSTGTQIVSATVNSGVASALTGKFRYTNIASTTLTHGTTYVIGATTGTNDHVAYGDSPTTLTGLTVDSAITLTQNKQDDGSHAGLSFPNLHLSTYNLFAGPNFQFAPVGGGGGGGVPEPGTVGLLIASGFSSMGLAFRNRKIRK